MRCLINLLILFCAGQLCAQTLVEQTISFDNLTRTYLRYTPTQLRSAKIPIVLVLHGGTDTAQITASDARATARWKTIAERLGWLVVYPQGVGDQWNDCRQNTLSANPPSTANDVGFLRAVVAREASFFPLDSERIYVTGLSNGGLMSLRMAQEASDWVAGIGAVIANLPVDPIAECTPLNLPITSVQMPGTLDPLIPFNGNTSTQSFLATRLYFSALNGCGATPVSTALADLDVADGSTVTRLNQPGCVGDKATVSFRVDGGGHSMPSIAYVIAGANQNHDIEAAEEIANVLSKAKLHGGVLFADDFEF
jgi:polyhydroxybutyrate depolymerase